MDGGGTGGRAAEFVAFTLAGLLEPSVGELVEEVAFKELVVEALAGAAFVIEGLVVGEFVVEAVALELGVLGMTKWSSGFFRVVARDNCTTIRAVSPRQMILKTVSERSSIARFLLLPLFEVQDGDRQAYLDHGWPSGVRINLNRFDDQWVT